MKTKVLVVDDAQSMRSIVTSVVESLGYEAIQADSGEKALKQFQCHNIGIAVLDVNMDGIDGFETCRRLRKLAKNDWFPVIYLSTVSNDESIVEGLDAGGDAYVAKPVNPRVLEAILKAMGRIAGMKSELAKANFQLERLAAYDGLTQLFNRRSFDESLIRFSLQAKRELTSLTLLMIDLDYFKPYNDHYGHLQGDDCLKEFSKLLNRSLRRPVDTAFRYGGEEFAVLLPNSRAEGGEVIAQRIKHALEKAAIEHVKSTITDYLTVSVGIALSVNGEIDPNELIARADSALYEAKKQGRNRYVVDQFS